MVEGVVVAHEAQRVPGRTPTVSREMVSWDCRRNSSVSTCGFAPRFRSFIRSETRNSTKNTRVNADAADGRHLFRHEVDGGEENRIAAIEPRPRGISLPPRRRLNGTFHSRCYLSLKRSTSMARALNANDQITPNA